MKIFGIYTKVKECLRKCKQDGKHITVESIQEQIPSYLTDDSKAKLAEALSEFYKRPIDYYTSKPQDYVLQGDGWNSFVVYDFDVKMQKPVRGILLTNTCDIAPDNKRTFPPKYTFSPIIKLKNYAQKLASAGLTQRQIDAKISDIKNQFIYTLFYLPKGAALDEEYIALLSDAHTISQDIFEARQDRQKLFSLSQIGFWLFIFKLSVHFCRLHENIARDPA